MPYASSILSQAGYDFKVLDCQRLKLNKFQTLQAVKKENPDIIFSLMGLPSMQKELDLLKEIKKDIENVLIVGVGTVCKVLSQELLSNKGVDVVLRDEYPYVFNISDFLQALQRSSEFKRINGISYKDCGKIIQKPCTVKGNLRELPSPSYDCIEFDGYESFIDIEGQRYLYVPILGSKGCPYPCIYCPYPVGFGKKPTFRSPEAIVDEIEYLHKNRKINGFLLRMQSFTLNLKHAEGICDEIIRRKLEIAWFCEARVDVITKQLLCKMRRSGCKRIHFGVETGDPELIKIAKPGVCLDDIKKAFRLTKEAGIWAIAHMILGWPDDNMKTVKNTCKFLKELDPDGINWNFLTPYPGTKIREIAQRDSLILTNDWSYYTSHTVVMRTKHLSAEQLYAAEERIIRNLAKQRLLKLVLRPNVHGQKQFKLFWNEVRALIGKILLSKASNI